MDGIFEEFENENSLRAYPFAAGCDQIEQEARRIPVGLFVDAAIYPINPAGTIYLSGISEDGTFEVSDDGGVVMSGKPAGGKIEFFDLSDFSRHVGTLLASSEEALDDFATGRPSRSYSKSETSFSSACVFPVVIDGVTSVSVGSSNRMTGRVSFSNSESDDVRVSSSVRDDGKSTMRFDVLPRPGQAKDDSIKRIICVVDGETPFRIERIAYNIILVRLYKTNKEDVCLHAHGESTLEMVDTCKCGGGTVKRVLPAPITYQIQEVFIPPDDVPDGDEFGPNGGIRNGSDNAFYLVSANSLGSRNPISITLEDGSISPMTEDPEIIVDGSGASLPDGAYVDSITSKAVVIQVPGLSGGEI